MATAETEHPVRESKEASQMDLELALQQGRALQRTIKHMINDIAHDGREQQAGDYLIGYAVEEAEGLYRWRDGKLEWEEPVEENVHLEISARDANDGRFIPELKVEATLIDADGNEVGKHRQPFLWHSWLYHYGRNWKVPGDGRYRLKVAVQPPAFSRHDKLNGMRFSEAVEVEFDNVKIKTGRK